MSKTWPPWCLWAHCELSLVDLFVELNNLRCLLHAPTRTWRPRGRLSSWLCAVEPAVLLGVLSFLFCSLTCATLLRTFLSARCPSCVLSGAPSRLSCFQISVSKCWCKDICLTRFSWFSNRPPRNFEVFNLLVQLLIFLIYLFVGTYKLSSHARLEAFVIHTKLTVFSFQEFFVGATPTIITICTRFTYAA